MIDLFNADELGQDQEMAVQRWMIWQRGSGGAKVLAHLHNLDFTGDLIPMLLHDFDVEVALDPREPIGKNIAKCWTAFPEACAWSEKTRWGTSSSNSAVPALA